MYLNHQAKDWTSDQEFVPEILSFHQRLPDFAETPLRQLPSDICQKLGVGQILVKDESTRCGLPAFKILGASWGAYRAITERLDCLTTSSLDHVRHLAQETEICLYTATDGNHGRAVARIGKILGVKVSVFVPRIMLFKTREFIKEEGATVNVVDGDYDAAVRAAETESKAAHGILVQDTAWPGYEEIPKWIVQGYSTMLTEVDEQLKTLYGEGPDLVIVPIGVGSLAHAVVGHYKQKGRRTMVLAVEPDTAACLKASLERGRITTIETGDTSMCGMNCGTVSYTAWPYLLSGIDACVTVTDSEAADAENQLRDHEVHIGPCGAATLAAINKVCQHHKEELRLSKDSIIVLLATEGPR
ncbi:MAG: hypothetical protein Q9195_008761 [Heterodermia aff. obscurata]